MRNHKETAQIIRDDPDVHYNCAQALLMAFEDELPLAKEQAEELGTGFGAGILSGKTCGTITSALMILGMKGMDKAELSKIWAWFKERHEGCTDCAQLLAISRENGIERKPHCDKLVRDMAEHIDEILDEADSIL